MFLFLFTPFTKVGRGNMFPRRGRIGKTVGFPGVIGVIGVKRTLFIKKQKSNTLKATERWFFL